jgi:hypothetical protein
MHWCLQQVPRPGRRHDEEAAREEAPGPRLLRTHLRSRLKGEILSFLITELAHALFESHPRRLFSRTRP